MLLRSLAATFPALVPHTTWMLLRMGDASWYTSLRVYHKVDGNVLLAPCCTVREKTLGGVAVVYLLKLTAPIGQLWGRLLDANHPHHHQQLSV